MTPVLVLAVVLAAADTGRPPVAYAPGSPVTAMVNRLIAADLAAKNVRPAPSADDAAFFRRVNLALAGRVPAAADVRAFLADADTNKRAKAVDKLLESPAYANHFTTLWRGWLIPEAAANPEVAGLAPGFDAWLRPQIAGNIGYDKFVNRLLTYPLAGRPAMTRGQPEMAADAANPLAFYTAKEAKPENLAAATAKLFLGVQLECAQCHDHPFAKWSREQFWGLAAFYGGLDRQGGALREVTDRRELPIPNTDRIAVPAFLDDREPEWRFKTSGRTTLANWVTTRDNPFFAKAAVNRTWGYLFGVGIVDPVDDFNEKNPPSHPELLEELARAFAAGGFDTKALIRSLVLTDAFQRSSAAADGDPFDPRAYARFPVQGLTPDQIFDSLAVVLGDSPAAGRNAGSRTQFLENFAVTGKKTETQTTILQALTLMNGDVVAAATKIETSRTLAAIVDLPGLTPAERVEAIYLAILSRPPTPEEAARAGKHVAAGPPEKYADVLWALLNGVEFRTNH